MEAEGLEEDGVGVWESGGCKLGWVEDGLLGGVRVKQGLDLIANLGVDIAVLQE